MCLIMNYSSSESGKPNVLILFLLPLLWKRILPQGKGISRKTKTPDTSTFPITLFFTCFLPTPPQVKHSLRCRRSSAMKVFQEGQILSCHLSLSTRVSSSARMPSQSLIPVNVCGVILFFFKSLSITWEYHYWFSSRVHLIKYSVPKNNYKQIPNGD